MNIYDYEDLLKNAKSKPIKIKLYGSTICFTGKCANTRIDLEKYAYNRNAILKSSVGKELNYLVVPDNIDSVRTNSKFIKATELGIQIITESQFLKAE